MFKKKALKLYRKSINFENHYGSEMADKVMMGRLWYKIFTQQMIRVILKLMKKSKANSILFDTKPDFSGTTKALYDYMIEHEYNKRYKITWLVANPRECKAYRKHNVKFVQRIGKYHHFHTARSYFAALKARYVFFSEDFSWIEVKSKNQVYINLWHGCGFREGTEEEKTLTKFDYCLVPGDAFIKSKAKFFSCGKKCILPIGDPRYNQFQSQRSEVSSFMETLCRGKKDTKKILWMPIYRESAVQVKYKTSVASMMGLPLIQSLADMPLLNEICVKHSISLVVYCNPDSMTLYKETDELSNVHLITEENLKEAAIELYEILPKFDALLSDFAAVTFDYLLMDKPIGYILEDYEEYKRAAGFVFENPMDYMPGEHIYDRQQLEQFFTHVDIGEDSYKDARAAVRKKTHNETDNYCKRILEQFSIR